jgi:hypothetical protein
MPAAPVTNGNIACFSGTTGLLQNCATPVLPGSLTLNPTAGTLNAGLTHQPDRPNKRLQCRALVRQSDQLDLRRDRHWVC